MMHDRICKGLAAAVLLASVAFQMLGITPARANEFAFGLGALALSLVTWRTSERGRL
jgi:hypothetical protein